MIPRPAWLRLAAVSIETCRQPRTIYSRQRALPSSRRKSSTSPTGLPHRAGARSFGWLVHHPPGNSPTYVWEVDNLTEAPENLRSAADHARRFSTAIHGAALLYNLLLAEKSGNDDLVDSYTAELDDWKDELGATQVLRGWDRDAWWATVQAANPRLRTMTRTFVDRWLDLLDADDDVAASRDARTLVSDREKRIKGGRARLLNQSALDRWSGASGTGRHSFRWPVASSHLEDLYAARELERGAA